jgi:hypothetical protein
MVLSASSVLVYDSTDGCESNCQAVERTMHIDFIDWDDSDDPQGNVQHIADNGVTTHEVEEILQSLSAVDEVSRSTGRMARRGWTSTGKYLFVVYDLDDSQGIVVVYPITAYEIETPE